MRRNKRARVEGDGGEDRAGVTWRSPKHVVEMRLSKRVAENLKLHFGSYDTEDEAMVARDYGAYVRNSTGKEDCASVGGFRNPDVIFKFEESPKVFESLEGSGSRAQARCDEFKSLLELQTTEARIKFCKGAKEDIKVAIKLFPSRYPQTFPRPSPLNRLPNSEPVDGEIYPNPPPSSSEVRVSPPPGASMGEGSPNFIDALCLQLQTLVLTNKYRPTDEEAFKIVKAGINKMRQELFDKWLEELDHCSIEPESIPTLE